MISWWHIGLHAGRQWTNSKINKTDNQRFEESSLFSALQAESVRPSVWLYCCCCWCCPGGPGKLLQCIHSFALVVEGSLAIIGWRRILKNLKLYNCHRLKNELEASQQCPLFWTHLGAHVCPGSRVERYLSKECSTDTETSNCGNVRCINNLSAIVYAVNYFFATQQSNEWVVQRPCSGGLLVHRNGN